MEVKNEIDEKKKYDIITTYKTILDTDNEVPAQCGIKSIK